MNFGPELQALGGDARRIWGDAEERARTIAAVVHGLGAGGSILEASVERLDRAIETGLRVLGFPRGAIAGISFEYGMVMWAGRKDADCTLRLSATALRAAVAQQTPDDVFRTWVHESLHARQAFSRNYRREYARSPGYEEGAVEGLAQHLLFDRAGFPAIAGSFDYYVAAYRALAATLRLDGEAVWRALWHARPGEVRSSFPSALRRLHREASGLTLSAVPLAKLGAVADTVFSASRGKWLPDDSELTRLWEVALQ